MQDMQIYPWADMSHHQHVNRYVPLIRLHVLSDYLYRSRNITYRRLSAFYDTSPCNHHTYRSPQVLIRESLGN